MCNNSGLSEDDEHSKKRENGLFVCFIYQVAFFAFFFFIFFYYFK